MTKIPLSPFGFLLALSILALIATSCSDDDIPEVTYTYDCEFVQNDADMDGIIDDTEKAIMEECMEDKFTSKSDIESNLIGEWELIGHGEGWIPTVSQPCGYITITNDELVYAFENAYVDTTITHTWEIEDHGNGVFSLQVFPEYYDGLSMHVFCSDFMYGDATPFDGNMYLYKKVN